MNKYKSIFLALIAIAITTAASFAQDNSAPPDKVITLTQYKSGTSQYTISGENEVTLEPNQALTITINNTDNYFNCMDYEPVLGADTKPCIVWKPDYSNFFSVLTHDANTNIDDTISFRFLPVDSGSVVINIEIYDQQGYIPFWNKPKLAQEESFPITVTVQ
jgi:hypothetical protein